MRRGSHYLMHSTVIKVCGVIRVVKDIWDRYRGHPIWGASRRPLAQAPDWMYTSAGVASRGEGISLPEKATEIRGVRDPVAPLHMAKAPVKAATKNHRLAVFMSHPKISEDLRPSNLNLLAVASVALLRDAWTDFVLSRQALRCTARDARKLPMDAWQVHRLARKSDAPPHRDSNNRPPRAAVSRPLCRQIRLVFEQPRHAIRTLLRFWHKEGYLPQPVTFDMRARVAPKAARRSSRLTR